MLYVFNGAGIGSGIITLIVVFASWISQIQLQALIFVRIKHNNSRLHSLEISPLLRGNEEEDEKYIAYFLIPWNDPLPAGSTAVCDDVVLPLLCRRTYFSAL